jgi:hypothetical protein
MNSLLKFLTESRKLIVSLIWLAVAVIIVSGLGRYIYQKQLLDSPRKDGEAVIPKLAIDWSAVDASIAQAMKSAHAKAEKQADAKLDAWIASLMARVDSDFLEWYFSYWTQQVLGVKGIWYWMDTKVRGIWSEPPTVVEKITEDIQEQFANRVLRPQIGQMEMERISREVLTVYVAELSRALKDIPSKYKLPAPEWERYLDDIAVITSNVEGNRKVELTMKTVAAATAVATTVTVKAMAPAIAKVGSKLSAKLAGKATAKLAAKTGAKVTAKTGGKFLGPIVGIAVVIWDVWDHNATKATERPILRQNLVDYFAEMKQLFLHEAETGIMSIVGSLEGEVLKQLRK